eukprot:147071_1
MLVFVVLLILYVKTKDFNDIYHIKKEIQYQTFILLFILFIDIVAVTYELSSGVKTQTPHRELEWIISVLLSDIAWFSICLISTAFPLYLYKQKANQSLIKHHKASPSGAHDTYLTQLLDTISHKDGFKSFMLHLIREYSTENLLFLLELVQIKSNHKHVCPTSSADTKSDDHMVEESNRIQTKLIHSNGRVFCTVVVPAYHVPQSVVLEQYTNDLWQQMVYLYDKYIKWGSDHELNISYETRNSLQEVFETRNASSSWTETDLFKVMDAS